MGQSFKIKPQIGDKIEDGTVYAGISSQNCRRMYVMSEDAPDTMKWKQAMEYATNLNAHGHQDWHLPTKRELAQLFKNRAAIGNFNNGSYYKPGRFYWSSTKEAISNFVWLQDFTDGWQSSQYPEYVEVTGNLPISVRCIRYG